MKTIARLASLLILLLLAVTAHGLTIKKNAQQQTSPKETVQFRNALTDVSLTRIGTEEASASDRISLAYMPRDYNESEGEKHVSTYHGKHVTAIVFLSIAALALIGAYSVAKHSRNSSDAPGVLLGFVAAAALFLGFFIPGNILICRYPHNQPHRKA